MTLFDKNIWAEIFISIKKNKTRTFLTSVGVTTGIFVYVVLSGTINGLNNGFGREFQNISHNTVFIWAKTTSMPYSGFKSNRQIQLKYSDADALRQKIPELIAIAPRNAKGVFGTAPASVSRGSKSENYSIFGDFPDFIKIANKKIYSGGRFINPLDIKDARKVCIIGERTQEELFKDNENPVGSFIKINNLYFQVVGIHGLSGGGVPFDSDRNIFIPFTTYKKLYNTGENVSWFTIAAKGDASIFKVEEMIKKELSRIHKIHPTDKRAIGSFNLGVVFNKILGFSTGLTTISIIVGIATILAGVIGIGSILLISIDERTKEIGIRRALGAKPSDIRNHIIIESFFLTFTSGFIGVLASLVTLKILDTLTANLENVPFSNPHVSIEYVIGALFILAVLGTLIGLIPAYKAIQKKPIEALKEE